MAKLWRFFYLTIVVVLAKEEEKSQFESEKEDEGKSQLEREKEELVFVHSIWRHGLVTPAYDFVHPGQQSFRESLPGGMIELFNLGKILRSLYVNNRTFLSPDRVFEEIYIRSIDYNRSLTGAAANLAGMFPRDEPILDKLKGWPSNWVPIPIHTMSLMQDNVLNMGTICPTFAVYYNNNALIQPYNKTLQENQGFFNYLSNVTNVAVTRDNIGLVWASVTPQYVPESQIPSWATPKVTTQMKYLAELEMQSKMNNTGMIRLRGGPGLTEIMNRMKLKWDIVQNKTNSALATYLDRLKFFGYSCRGMPIEWQLAALGAANITKNTVPNFSSCLIYELWNRDGNPYVSVRYYDGFNGYKTAKDFFYVQVKSCPKLPAKCPLETLQKLLDPYMISPNEWFQECATPNIIAAATVVPVSSPQVRAPSSYQSLSVIFAMIIIVLTCFIIVQMCILMRPRRRPGYAPLNERTLLVSNEIK